MFGGWKKARKMARLQTVVERYCSLVNRFQSDRKGISVNSLSPLDELALLLAMSMDPYSKDTSPLGKNKYVMADTLIISHYVVTDMVKKAGKDRRISGEAMVNITWDNQYCLFFAIIAIHDNLKFLDMREFFDRVRTLSGYGELMSSDFSKYLSFMAGKLLDDKKANKFIEVDEKILSIHPATETMEMMMELGSFFNSHMDAIQEFTEKALVQYGRNY